MKSQEEKIIDLRIHPIIPDFDYFYFKDRSQGDDVLAFYWKVPKVCIGSDHNFHWFGYDGGSGDFVQDYYKKLDFSSRIKSISFVSVEGYDKDIFLRSLDIYRGIIVREIKK